MWPRIIKKLWIYADDFIYNQELRKIPERVENTGKGGKSRKDRKSIKKFEFLLKKSCQEAILMKFS